MNEDRDIKTAAMVSLLTSVSFPATLSKPESCSLSPVNMGACYVNRCWHAPCDPDKVR